MRTGGVGGASFEVFLKPSLLLSFLDVVSSALDGLPVVSFGI